MFTDQRELIRRDLPHVFPSHPRFVRSEPRASHTALVLGSSSNIDTIYDSGSGDGCGADGLRGESANRPEGGLEYCLLDALERVLVAVAVRSPQGYIPAMCTVAGVLLLLSETDGEERAFWMLAAFVEDLVPWVFTRGATALNAEAATVDFAVEVELPALHAKLRASSVRPALLVAGWLTRLGVTVLPGEGVLRLWDSLILEGSDVLVHAALVFLQLHGDALNAVSTGEGAALLDVADECAAAQFELNQVVAAAVVRTREARQDLGWLHLRGAARAAVATRASGVGSLCALTGALRAHIKEGHITERGRIISSPTLGSELYGGPSLGSELYGGPSLASGRQLSTTQPTSGKGEGRGGDPGDISTRDSHGNIDSDIDIDISREVFDDLVSVAYPMEEKLGRGSGAGGSADVKHVYEQVLQRKRRDHADAASSSWSGGAAVDAKASGPGTGISLMGVTYGEFMEACSAHPTCGAQLRLIGLEGTTVEPRVRRLLHGHGATLAVGKGGGGANANGHERQVLDANSHLYGIGESAPSPACLAAAVRVAHAAVGTVETTFLSTIAAAPLASSAAAAAAANTTVAAAAAAAAAVAAAAADAADAADDNVPGQQRRRRRRVTTSNGSGAAAANAAALESAMLFGGSGERWLEFVRLSARGALVRLGCRPYIFWYRVYSLGSRV
jgi:hypothetical protein